jgi:hypothetical protein
VALVLIDSLRDHLNLNDSSHDGELQLYLDAAEERVASRYGTLPSGDYAELLIPDSSGRLMPAHWPVLTVVSAADAYGLSYTTGFTISANGLFVTHPNITSGSWTVSYTAGLAAVPADLVLAVLEDIRGLYQPSQLGPPGAFGAFGIETPGGSSPFRPVNQWPRVDSWIADRRGA